MKYMTYSIYKQGIIQGGFNPSAHCGIGFDRQALPDTLEKLTLDLLSHTPRDEILYF